MRSLIVLVSASAVVTMIVVRPITLARNQWIALERIATLGGKFETGVVVSDNAMLGSRIAERFYPGMLTTTLINVDLTDCEITDNDVKLISNLRFMRKLTLTGTAVGDQAIKQLRNQERLIHLDISGTAVTDEGIQSLIDVESLKSLRAMDCSVSTRSLALMDSALPGRRFVEQRAAEDLANTGAFVGYFTQPADDPTGTHDLEPQKDILYLVATPEDHIINDDFVFLIGQLHSLPELVIEKAKLGQARLDFLATNPSIKNLTIRNVEINDFDLSSIARMKQLERLHLEGCETLTGHNLSLLQDLPNLRLLLIKGCPKVPDSQLRSLAKNLVRCDCDFEYRNPFQPTDAIDVYSAK
jgi:hypothetical protein